LGKKANIGLRLDLSEEKYKQLNAILEELPEEARNQITKPIIITRYSTDDEALKNSQDLTKDKNILIGNKTLVNKIMSVCGYTIQNQNTGDVGAVALDEKVNLSAFKSLFALNVGGVTENLEKSERGLGLLDAVFSSPTPL
jgi:hypothetical protein